MRMASIRFDAAKRRDQDYWKLRVCEFNFLSELESGHAGHFDVEMMRSMFAGCEFTPPA